MRRSILMSESSLTHDSPECLAATSFRVQAQAAAFAALSPGRPCPMPALFGRRRRNPVATSAKSRPRHDALRVRLHAGCPLARQGTVVREVWRQQCTCPGAGPVRERQERAEEWRREVAEVLADLPREGHLAPEEIEDRLRTVYLTHGEAPPPGVTGWARMVAVGTARPGTRSPRLVWMGIRAVARTVRWARGPRAAAGTRTTEQKRASSTEPPGLSR
jgi:hypothetical protein